MALSKFCKKCNVIFEKEANCSMKRWNSSREFCSNQCLFAWRRNNPEYKSKLNLSGLALGHESGNTHGFKSGFYPWNKDLKGIHLSPNSEFKIGQFAKEKNPNWKGGISGVLGSIRSTREYREWRSAILERDGYECIECFSTEKLQADHIKPFAYFPELRFELSNGRTLCIDCHKKTDTYAGKAVKYALLLTN